MFLAIYDFCINPTIQMVVVIVRIVEISDHDTVFGFVTFVSPADCLDVYCIVNINDVSTQVVMNNGACYSRLTDDIILEADTFRDLTVMVISLGETCASRLVLTNSRSDEIIRLAAGVSYLMSIDDLTTNLSFSCESDGLDRDVAIDLPLFHAPELVPVLVLPSCFFFIQSYNGSAAKIAITPVIPTTRPNPTQFRYDISYSRGTPTLLPPSTPSASAHVVIDIIIEHVFPMYVSIR
jgi:hypothetical protein